MRFNINGSAVRETPYCFRPGIIPKEEENKQEKAGNNAKPWEKKAEKAQEQEENEEETPEEIEEEIEENDPFLFDQRQKITPVLRILGICSGVGYMCSVGLILANGPIKAILEALCIASALFIAGDPLQLITLFIAPQTRAITSINILLWGVLVIVPDMRYLSVVATISAVSIVVCIPSNAKWLHYSRIFRTHAVMHSRVKDKKNAAVIAWKEHGKRETRTAYLEAHLDFCEQVLNSYGLAGFVIGFYAAEKRFVKIRHELEEIREELDKEQDKRRDMLFDKKDAEREAEEYKKKANVYASESKQTAQLNASLISENNRLKAENQRLKEKLSRRSEQEPPKEQPEEQENNTPLLAGIEAEAARIREEKEEKQAAEDEKTREYVAKVKEMLKQTDENGNCIFGGPAGIGRHLGISKYYAKKYIAIASAEIEAENAA